MPEFLDLPREIRDLIYGHALTSPTSRYLVTLQKNRFLPNLPPTSIRLQPCNVYIRRPVRGASPPNMAFQRTCKQIHTETLEWIWKHNIIVFANANDAMVILKRMGQELSRKIQRVVLHVDPGWYQHKPNLVKVLGMLASRTRKGDLREVGLVIDIRKEEIMPISNPKYPIQGDLLYMRQAIDTNFFLKKGAKAGWAPGKVARTLEIRYDPRSYYFNRYTCNDRYYDRLDAICADCHHAWGGKVICSSTVVYDAGRKVAEIPPSPLRLGKRICRESARISAFLLERIALDSA